MIDMNVKCALDSVKFTPQGIERVRSFENAGKMFDRMIAMGIAKRRGNQIAQSVLTTRCAVFNTSKDTTPQTQ